MTYDHQIWQGDTAGEGDLNEINQAGAAGVIMSRSRDKLKPFYVHYHSVYGYHTWQDYD